jgi:hypothetical protein
MAINEPILRDALVTLAEQCRAQYLELAATITEVAALHKTMQEMQPRFLDMLTEQKENLASNQKTAAAIRGFDEIIRRLKTDSIH